jgi:hypothetical protein
MTALAVDAALAVEFLRAWFACTPDHEWVMLFGIDRVTGERLTAWAPVSHIEWLTADIERMALRGDLWFGVATRRQRLHEGKRGGVADCGHLPGLYVDIDVESEGHKQPGLPPTMEEAIALAKRFSIKAQAVIRSGYGLQCFWRFAEAVPADDAIGLLARWGVTWRRLAGEYHIDPVWSLDRVMRLPGTGNWKEVTR